MYVSRNVDDNLYIYISINEKEMLKDKAKLYNLFTNQELNEIFSKVVTKKFLLQDREKRTYSLENIANVSTVNVLEQQDFTTYLIILNNNAIEFPAKILFNYSFKFRYYRFLDEKIKNSNQISTITENANINTIYKQIIDYDESLVNFNYSETIRDTETIETGEIDFRNSNSVKERVTFSSSEIFTKSLLNQYILNTDGFLPFNNIIIDRQIKDIKNLDDPKITDYYGKLINNISDYDYKRFLNQLSVFINSPKLIRDSTISQDNRENTANTNTFSEDGLFKRENTSLKIDKSADSQNLFLAFILSNGPIEKPTSEEETKEYNVFLADAFSYPKYFFKNVLKFKLEYLQTVDNKSMRETWTEINATNIDSVLNLTNIFCRVSLKNKKYFDKVAYEYFLLRA